MGHIRTLILAVVAVLTATVAIAQSEYRVRAGDTLVVEVLEDSELNRSAVVLSDGRISFPLAGTVLVAGRTVGEVEATLRAAIAPNFATVPNVFVAVLPGERNEPAPVIMAPAPDPTIEIFFLGEVNSPGTVAVAPGTRFLQAMARTGGLTRFAADKRVQLRRTDQHTGQTHLFEINYRAILDGAALQNNIVMEEGDVIVVPERRLFE
ncbi:polysaccharide biosynthesis/export family protein [Octadecabacter sp. CECT 8868]|uniref:polysaccharide biosynthesis/export family protein n=1 Tax=Octadecabacter algicola TaxID=2909342 RepID=UPI001F21EC1B|nr:polysaccharide biosynthesis/export family protein [Octadecabacter algicola]MCF2906687.1 polysaccharide biosynthesis/export family protein [Octadecabacter algicola]